MKSILALFIIIFGLSANAQNFKITEEKGKYGVVNKKGEIILSNKYVEIYECEYSPVHLIAFGKKSKIYIVNTETKEKYEVFEFEDQMYLDEKCMLTEKNRLRYIYKGKVGLLQFPQTVLIEPQYDMICNSDELEDTYIISKKKLNRLLFLDSKKRTPWFEVFDYNETFNYSDGICVVYIDQFFFVKIDGKDYIMNIYGNRFPVEKFDGIDFYTENYDLLLTKKDDKYGFMDSQGNIIIDCIYEDADWFYDYYAPVKYKGKYGLLGYSQDILVPFIYDKIIVDKKFNIKATLNNKTIVIESTGELLNYIYPELKEYKWGFLTGEGKVIIDYKFADANDFSEGMALVNIGGTYKPEEEYVRDGKWGYIAPTGDFVINPVFEEAENFTEGLAAVKKDNKWGYIDYTGEFVINNIYDSASSFLDGLGVVTMDDKVFYIDKHGVCKKNCP